MDTDGPNRRERRTPTVVVVVVVAFFFDAFGVEEMRSSSASFLPISLCDVPFLLFVFFVFSFFPLFSLGFVFLGFTKTVKEKKDEDICTKG